MIEVFYCKVEAIYFYNHCMFNHFFEQIDIQGELHIQYEIIIYYLSIGLFLSNNNSCVNSCVKANIRRALRVVLTIEISHVSNNCVVIHTTAG